jgi:hypothetical protein
MAVATDVLPVLAIAVAVVHLCYCLGLHCSCWIAAEEKFADTDDIQV